MISFIFYLFAALLTLASLMVITLRNPVHAVLFLIFAFFNASGLFILLGAEYIAMTLIIVYVGAVAVLFLFVVMMLNINLAQTREGFLKSLPLGIFLAVLTFVQIAIALMWSKDSFVKSVPDDLSPISELTNTEAIGHVLYTDYVFAFQMCGLILLVAMIGAILLTLVHSKGVKRQSIFAQVSRNRKSSIEVVKVKSREGVEL
jgi:NADH-quinone oxidoreductase subunit J